MGRPKKRKVQDEEDQTNNSANMTNETSPSSIEKDSPIEMRRDVDMTVIQGDLELASEIAFDPGVAGIDQPIWGCDTNTSPETDPTLLGLDSLPSKPSCSCLANIYLCLEETRATEPAPFSSGLTRLRSVTSRALAILQCNVCPTDFVWAMQNSQLLNTLLVSIAETYRTLVESITEEARRAAQNNETKTLFINESQPGVIDGSFATPSLHVNLTPKQWELVVKSAVKDDIFGTSNSTLGSFANLLQAMEDRQIGWHSGLLGSCIRDDHHHAHRHSTDKEPMCVMLVRHTKAIINRLELNP
ncbi:hypothetical protein B0T10DRAFT_456813 [Thelonectria olida]|uniref:Uncharacterized protein n=1 Tax=Thelonectria olida TaxID=1576542 RepID=A0A9P8WBP3_9HYPO|nr:hypothetical protein B0T10DRAFT_456813 [Thelonectria olida]